MKHHSLSRIVMPAAALLLALLISTTARAEPVVSNVRSAQVAGTHKVEIRYDLANPGGESSTVSVEISADGGTTYASAPPASFEGAVGANVSPGTDKTITVRLGEIPTLNSTFSKNVRFRVNAKAGGGNPGWAPDQITSLRASLLVTQSTAPEALGEYILDLPPEAFSDGWFIYEKTGPNTGRLRYTTIDDFSGVAEFTFTSSTSGTFTDTYNSPMLNGTDSGTFEILQITLN